MIVVRLSPLPATPIRRSSCVRRTLGKPAESTPSHAFADNEGCDRSLSTRDPPVSTSFAFIAGGQSHGRRVILHSPVHVHEIVIRPPQGGHYTAAVLAADTDAAGFLTFDTDSYASCLVSICQMASHSRLMTATRAILEPRRRFMPRYH